MSLNLVFDRLPMKKLPEKPPGTLNIVSDTDALSWFNDPDIQKKAADFNKKYYYWSELKYRVPDETERKWICIVLLCIGPGARLEAFEIGGQAASFTGMSQNDQPRAHWGIRALPEIFGDVAAFDRGALDLAGAVDLHIYQDMEEGQQELWKLLFRTFMIIRRHGKI